MSPSGDGWFGRPILRPAKEPPLPQIQHPAGHPLVTLGSQLDFRAQTPATFKILFNAIVQGPAEAMSPPAIAGLEREK